MSYTWTVKSFNNPLNTYIFEFSSGFKLKNIIEQAAQNETWQ